MRRLVLIAVFVLSACREELAEVPDAIAMSEDALGHYCQMRIQKSISTLQRKNSKPR